MAKLEHAFTGDFDRALEVIDAEIRNGSASASYEDGADIDVGESRVAVRVYERYSFMGGNRVSLNITLVGTGDDLYLTGITSGGSEAVFFKLNTFGEEAFLNKLRKAIDRI